MIRNLKWLVFILALPLISSCLGNEFSEWNEVINEFERLDQKNPPGEDVVLFVGSSSIRFWQGLESEYPEHNVLNRGFGGSEFSDVLHFADRLIYKYKPSRIFIYEGENDLVNGESVESVTMEAIALREQIAERLGEKIPVIFISVKPSVARWELREKFLDVNSRIQEYAEQKPNTWFADVWTPMLGLNGVVRDDIFIGDRIHLNSKGYEIWAEVMVPFLEVEPE